MPFIESLIRDEGGSRITIDGTPYHFAPMRDGRHLAEVTEQTHIATLLSHPEGWRLADPPEAQPRSVTEALQSASEQDKTAGASVSVDAGQTVPEGQDDAEQDQAPNPLADMSDDDIDALSNDEAAKLFTEVEGRGPGRAKPETIRAKLKDLRAGVKG